MVTPFLRANGLTMLFDQMKRIFRENQFDGQFIKGVIDAQNGNFDLIMAQNTFLANLAKRRYELFLAQYSDNTQLSQLQIEKLCTFNFITPIAFETIQEWSLGDDKFEFETNDQTMIARKNNYNSLYEIFQAMGAFVHMKKEAMEFKQTIKQLTTFAKIKDVPHLFLQSLIFDNDKTRHMEEQYQRILAKKLSGHIGSLGVESGDEALCQLQYLFAKFMSQAARIASGLSEEIQQ